MTDSQQQHPHDSPPPPLASSPFVRRTTDLPAQRDSGGGGASPSINAPPHGSRSSSSRHHSGTGGRLAGLWRPPFERTWSVPEQYGTTCSSPGSKCSSRSSIEQAIKGEPSASMPYSPPMRSRIEAGEGAKEESTPLASVPVYGGVQCTVCLDDKSTLEGMEEEDNSSMIVWSHQQSPPSHSAGFTLEQPLTRSDSVEKRAKRSLFGAFGAFTNSNGRSGLRNFSNGVPVTASAAAAGAAQGDCSTLPNSPTMATKRSGFAPIFGRVRRFPSLKFQRQMHAMRPGGSQPLVHPIARKTIVRSTPTLQDGRGPTITITTHSDEELQRGGGHRLLLQRSGVFNSAANIGDETSLYGTPKEQLSPPKDSGLEHQKSVATSTSNFLRDQIISFFQPSDNKLAMKLFGNKNALMREKMRQKAAGNWVIHPCSNFRFYWDLFMLVLLIANLIILPVAISFFNDDLSTHWIVFNGISDTVFLLDLVINFRTGIIADNFADDIILEPKEIAKHYLRTWFLLDLISSIPLDYIILILSPDASVTQLIHAGRALRIFRLVKLLSLLRLLRLSRLVRYVNQWEEDIGQFLTVASKFMRIVNLVCLILLLGHWNGCLQWLVPMLQDFPRDSWAALEELQDAHWSEQYTWALFKALSHMLCIGYGRYPPQSTTDVWLTTVSMLTGATCYALFVGHSTTLIQSFDTSRRLYREKFKQVEEYMIYRKLPRKLRQKITEYYEHRYQGKMFDEQSILAEVNECLREEIINYNCRALVASVPFFTHADPNFVSDVVTNLRHEMFQPGDFIIREGSVGNKMYFIQEGIVDIITQNGEVATSLSDGSYFGEVALLANTKRVASVRAETYCNLFSLSVEHFDAVLERYPLMRRTMESVAAERLNKIGKDPSILSNREDLEADISMVNELIMRATPLPSSGSEDSDGPQGNDEDDGDGGGGGGGGDGPRRGRTTAAARKRRKKDDGTGIGSRGGGGGGGHEVKEKDTLTVKIATMLKKSRSNISVRQCSKDEKEGML